MLKWRGVQQPHPWANAPMGSHRCQLSHLKLPPNSSKATLQDLRSLFQIVVDSIILHIWWCYIYNVYTVFTYRGYVLNDLNGFNDSSFTITFIRNRNYRRCIMMHPWAISDIQGLTRAVLHSGPSGTLSSCIATWSDIGSCQAEDRGYWELNPHIGDTFQTLTISNHGWGQETYVFMCFDYVFIDHCVLDCYSLAIVYSMLFT